MSASARQFARHYAEMVVAMFLGMIVLGAPLFAAMFLPTFVAIALLPAGIAMNTLLVGEHVAMLAAMFGAMLLRRDEYAHGDHAHAEAVA